VKFVARFLAVVLVLGLIGAAGLIIAAVGLNQAPAGLTDAVEFTVDSGEYLNGIAQRLESAGVIRSSLYFRVLARVRGLASDVKKGEYRFDPGMSSVKVLDLLVQGQERLYEVTIPEGYRATQIAEVLEDAGVTSARDFLAAVENVEPGNSYGVVAESWEGFLYPDTYLFPREYPAEQVVDHLVSTFFARLSEVQPEWRRLDWEELYRTVVLASIVEREYRIIEEAPKISSVFWNRLDIGMKLQSCATVVYAMTEEYGMDHPTRLLYADLEIPSAFNTYANTGLPPAPISNPGKVTLQAAFFPDETDYLFFVLEDPTSGKSYFSRDYADHLSAYELYIKDN
jgi:UPF0755 protein